MTINVDAASEQAISPTNWLQSMFAIRKQFETQLEQQRAYTLTLILLLLGGFISLFGTGVNLFIPNIVDFAGTGFLIVVIGGGTVFFAQYLILRYVKRLSFSVILFFVTWMFIVSRSPASNQLIAIGYALPIVVSAVMFRPRIVFIVAAFSMGAIILDILQDINAGEIVGSRGVLNIVGTLGILSLQAVIIALFSQSLQGWLEIDQRRSRQLEAAAVISETAATAPTLSTLLDTVVERIQTAYGFYHAQVFLLDDENRMARLEASTGRAGEALLLRGHSLPVGSRSVIGQCTYRGISVVINDVRDDPTHRPNELLPDTRGELALPLIVGREVIGALDVQSVKANDFQPEDIRSLQIMTGQLANAIEKARLVDELQSRANENLRLLEESQNALQQIEELNRRLTSEGWSDYLRTRHVKGTLGYTLHEDSLQRDISWTAPMRQAYLGEKMVVIRQEKEANIAAVPLRVRGEVIGVLEFERPGNKPWSDIELEMAEVLVDRLSLAVENARLFEQASLAAEREHIVNEIAQGVQSAESIDVVLQTALTELSAVLGASRGIVQITPREDDAKTPADGEYGASSSDGMKET